MGSNIPKARDLLLAIADELDETEVTYSRAIKRIVGTLMIRAKSLPRGPIKADKMTAKKKAEIKRLVRRNPSLLNREIGEMAGVDGGRVSEVKHPGWRQTKHEYKRPTRKAD